MKTLLLIIVDLTAVCPAIAWFVLEALDVYTRRLLGVLGKECARLREGLTTDGARGKLKDERQQRDGYHSGGRATMVFPGCITDTW